MEELKPKGRQKKVTQDQVKLFERKLNKTQKVHHDLFRLDLVDTRKNMSWEDGVTRWVDVPHAHFYHTTNSDGIAQKNSAPTAGHFHPIDVEYNEKGEIVRVECGPPMVMHKGKPHPYKNDNHTHEMSYLESEEVDKRVKNSEALKMMQATRSEEESAKVGVRGMLK